jgi:tetratricopeptide (TPR) repeat protein
MTSRHVSSSGSRSVAARFLILGAAIVALVALGALPLKAQQRIPSEHDLLLMKAIEHIDNGKVESARALLAEGIERFPSDPSFPYELAFIHYNLEEYREAAKILEKLTEHPKAIENFFQLLGNAYDMLGDPKKAIATYERGLERFPGSGPLHLELGVISAMHEEYPAAVRYWETGIEKAPEFPSNYYHAARMYMGTTERGWGMLYGEIFLNIEPGSQRSATTRQQLFDAWSAAITKESEDGAESDTMTSSLTVSLFKNLVVEADSTMKLVIPFEFFLVRSFATAAVAAGDEGFSIATLHRIRRSFLEHWYSDTTTAAHFDIELFARWRELEKAGLFDAYDHMLFYCPATSAEVDAWSVANGAKLREVTAWLKAHPIGGAKERPFARTTVGGLTLTQEELDATGAVEESE